MIKKPYIICSAIYIKNSKTDMSFLHKNIKNGWVIAGRRHHNCYCCLFSIKPDYRKNSVNIDDGFITSDDRFVNRKEAAKIAYEAGQIKDEAKCLVSEDLY